MRMEYFKHIHTWFCISWILEYFIKKTSISFDQVDKSSKIMIGHRLPFLWHNNSWFFLIFPQHSQFSISIQFRQSHPFNFIQSVKLVSHDRWRHKHKVIVSILSFIGKLPSSKMHRSAQGANYNTLFLFSSSVVFQQTVVFLSHAGIFVLTYRETISTLSILSCLCNTIAL